MRSFLIAVFIGGMSLSIAAGGWWNQVQAKAEQTPASVTIPQVIGAEFLVLVGLMTAVAAAGALFVGRAAESQKPSSGERLERPQMIPARVQLIREALDEGRDIAETAKLLKVSAADVGEVKRMYELRHAPVTDGRVRHSRVIPAALIPDRSTGVAPLA
jgi:hypothetical protein